MYLDEYEGIKYIQREGVPGIFSREPNGKKRRITYCSISQVIINKEYTAAQDSTLTLEDINLVFNGADQNWAEIEDISIIKPRYIYNLNDSETKLSDVLSMEFPSEFKELLLFKINRLWKKISREHYNYEQSQIKPDLILSLGADDEYVLNESISLNGYLEDSDDAPVANKTFTLTLIFSDESTEIKTVTTDENGEWEVEFTASVLGKATIVPNFETIEGYNDTSEQYVTEITIVDDE